MKCVWKTSTTISNKNKKTFLDYFSIQSLVDDLYTALVPTNQHFFYYYYILECGLGQAVHRQMFTMSNLRDPRSILTCCINSPPASVKQRNLTGTLHSSVAVCRCEQSSWFKINRNLLFCFFSSKFQGHQPVLEGVFDVGFWVDELLSTLLSTVFIRLGGTGLVFLDWRGKNEYYQKQHQFRDETITLQHTRWGGGC